MYPPIECLLSNMGEGRDIYLLRNGNVLKVDKQSWLDTHNESQSKREIDLWSLEHEDNTKYLCPILEWGKLDDDRYWVVMPLVDTNYSDCLLELIALELVDKIGHIVSDIDTQNIGKLDNHWVIIDYGL